MKELSLFSGAGGGLLGSKILGWECVGYVENNEHCQKVLRQRIADGILDAAPIFGDIRKFLAEGYADAYTGMVDIVTGGFPCQPFSPAGKRFGKDDSRNLWPETINVIRRVGPKFALLENTSGLLAYEYFGEILGDLADSGYGVQWVRLGANDVGAMHKRQRIFVFAYPNSDKKRCNNERQGVSKIAGQGRVLPLDRPKRLSSTSTNAVSFRRNENEIQTNTDTKCKRKPCETWGPTRVIPCQDASGRLWGFSDADIHRRFDGMAYWMDRLGAIGNGQVPLCMAYAYEVLSRGIVGEIA